MTNKDYIIVARAIKEYRVCGAKPHEVHILLQHMIEELSIDPEFDKEKFKSMVMED